MPSIRDFLIAAAALLALLATNAAALEAPPNWRAQTRDGAEVFTPGDLQETEILYVTIFPHAPLEGASLVAWLRKKIEDDAAPHGQWANAQQVKRVTEHMAVGSRSWPDAQGQQGDAVYSAISMDGVSARLGRVVENGSPASKRHNQAVRGIMGQLVTVEQRAAAVQGRVANMKTAPRADNGADADAAKMAKQKKAAQLAEARRYKHVTEPGKGLAASDIEAVAYGWEETYRTGQYSVDSYTYLLLKDGSVHNGLPVPPEDMNVADSKQLDARRWGRWRKKGREYEFAWGKGDQFTSPRHLVVAEPPQANQRVQGTWGASSSSSIGSAGSWNSWGVKLTADGRFEKSHSGGSYISTPAAEGASASAAHNDEDASWAVSAPNAGGGGTTKSNKTKADRSGTYTIKGYTMELRYDNGRIARMPFFVFGNHIWFEGASLMRERK